MTQPIFLFDYDGTLADSLAVWEQCMARALAALGVPPLADHDQFLGLLDDNMHIGLRDVGLDEAQIQALLAELRPVLVAEQDNTPLFAGIPEMLRELSQRAQVAVVTSNVGAVVSAKLAEEGLLAYVTDVLGIDAEPSKVRKIQRFQRQVPESAPVHYVGDTLGDMREGRTAGAVTVAVAWGWHSVERMRAAAPDVVAQSPQDILALVK
jgi:phosphoglycolate phosphatase